MASGRVSKEKSYKLEKCQINTPHEIVRGFWRLIKNHRTSLGRIIDIGAGDGRFALGGSYSYYEGLEIDKNCKQYHKMPKRAIIKYGCAFDYPDGGYNACIGNPPYVRHHDIHWKWREKIINMVRDELNISLNRRVNLFVYFICLGLMKTKTNGIVGLIVPYEWVSRPSTKVLRDYISSNGWGVDIYRFKDEIFSGVLTTASITVIDKAKKDGRWKFYDIDSQLNVYPRKGISVTRYSILPYEKRAKIWAMRGLSPGTQKVFTLSEESRIHFGLKMSDVTACVTSLQNVPNSLRVLDKVSFKKYFIEAGRKCWLILSNKPLSTSLKQYLRNVPENQRNTYTCNSREPWYAFAPHPSPKILYGSGFTTFGPKFLVNTVGAVAAGSVHGIHSNVKNNKRNLRDYLARINFEKHVVPHAGALKKVEVGQMNGVLNKYLLKRKQWRTNQ